MAKPKREKISEVELCAGFVKWADGQGWTAYAETSGFDIVMVRRSDGRQIGVHAKLAFNATLLRQALPDRYWRAELPKGPEHRAILLPAYDRDISEVAAYLGLVYFYRDVRPGFRANGSYGPVILLHRPGLTDDIVGSWLHWPASGPLDLPAYVPDVPAGASAPVQLTDWKIRALRITAILETTGHVTLDDFRRHGIDHRRWVPSGWLIFEAGVYRRGPNMAFDRQHPRVYRDILQETRRDQYEESLRAKPEAVKAKPRKRKR